MLAWVLIAKFLDHLPLLAGTNRCKGWHDLVPFHADRLDGPSRRRFAALGGTPGLASAATGPNLHADAPPVPLLNPGNGKTKKAYLATTCNRGPRSSSSTIKPVAAAGMRSSFCKTGTAT